MAYNAKGSKSGNNAKKEEKKLSVLKYIRSVFTVTKDGATPINWGVIFLIFVAMFGSCYSITFLFPFLPDMILYFGYAEEDKGYYTGLIASSMFFGRMFGSYFWGWLSDKKGRKPVMLICLSLLVVTNIGFGLVTSQLWAMVLRFLNGLVNGVIGACKSAMYEVCDNTNQAIGMSALSLGWGTGIILGPLLSGYLTSPAVKYPHVFAADGILGRYPFLLPALLAAFIAFLAIILIWWKFPETRERKRFGIVSSRLLSESYVTSRDQRDRLMAEKENGACVVDVSSDAVIEKRRRKLSVTQSIAANSLYHINPAVTECGLPGSARGNEISPNDNSAYFVDLTKIDYIDSGTGDETSRVYGLGSVTASREDLTDDDVFTPSSKEGEQDLPPGTLLLDDRYCSIRTKSCRSEGSLSISTAYLNRRTISRESRTTLGSVFVTPPDNEKTCSPCSQFFMNLNIVRLLRSPDVRYSVCMYALLSFGVIGWDDIFTVWASTKARLSGLDFSPEEIGSAIGLSSVPLLVLQVFLYPILESKFGAKKVHEVFCLYLIFASIVIPCLRAFKYTENYVALWACMLLLMGLQKICTTTCFSSVSLFVNNSATPDLAGSVNGMAMTLTAFARTLAPTMGGSMFAWSVTEGVKIGFPFDVNMAFIFFGLVYLGANVLCACTPESLNRQKKPNLQST